MADDKLGFARASSCSLQKRSSIQDQQHYREIPQVDSKHKPKNKTVSVAASNTRPNRIESLPPLPNVSTTGETDLPLVESLLPKSADDKGTDHFRPHKNPDTQRLQVFHKQEQLELGPSTNSHHDSLTDKNTNFGRSDVKLPKLISRGDITNPKTKEKPGETSLSQVPQSSVAKSKQNLRYVHVSTTGKTDLPLIESLPESADRGTNHFQPHKNPDIQRLLAFRKQEQLESGPSTNSHDSFTDKNINFGHPDVKLPKLISKGDIINTKTKEKPGETSLSQVPQSSVAKSKQRYVHVSAAGRTDLPLIAESANDEGTNHFQPHKNPDTQRLLAFHKQEQLESGPSTIPPDGHTNSHDSFIDKNTTFGHSDVKLPKLISKGDIMNPKTKQKPGETSLSRLPVAKSKQREVKRKRFSVSHTMSIDEENDMWSMIAIIENKIDQMEEGKRAQYRTRNSHRYHLPVVSVTDDLATVPKPWPINLIVVHTNKRRPGIGQSAGHNHVPPVYNDCAKVTMPSKEYKFGWKIRNISKRVEEAELSEAPFYSTTFTTGHNGYIMCLEAYLSGDGQDTHASLYLVMLDPDHDHPLVWPFIKPVTFQLKNQVDPAKSISMSFVSQLWSPSHRNAKWRDGLPRFFRRHLLLSYNNFNQDDQVIIKCKIDLDYNGSFIAAV